MIQVAYVICWWLALEVIGLVSFPLVSRVCSSLGDRGYSISKLVGLVVLTYLTWMLSSLKLLPFGSISIFVSFLLLTVVSLYFGRKHLRVADWPRKQMIISESVFAFAFIMFLLIRLGKPDIYFSGAADAFFNSAFFESVLRSDYFPPPDPWFAGESIPYYYGGHLLVAMLSVVTKVPSTIAFNIATAMFPALAVCASYGLGYNITKRKLYGFLTAFFVCIVGYTSGFFQLVAYISHHQVLGFLPLTVTNIKEWLLWFDFWSAPWLVEGALVHYPYFSFLLGDLHTYAMSIPFQLMFITLIFALFQRKHLNYKIALSDTLLDIFVLGLCLGFFFILNTWEYPTYIIFTLLAFILLRIRPSIKGTFAVMTAIIGLSFILYLAYYILGGMSGFRGLGLVTVKTSLSQFLEFGALFLFATCSLLYLRSKREVLLGWRMILICSLILIATVLAAILLHFPLLIIVVPIGLLSLYFICKSKPKSEKEFVLLLILMSAALIFFCEFIYIDDALDGAWARFNTIMKVYHQLWVLFGISAVFALYYVLNNLGRKTKVIWIIILIVLVLVSLIHPIASTTSALSGRHTHWGLNRGTLDGMAYVEKIDKGDYDAIKWINREIKGSPAILETPGNPNLYSCRVSAFTGLPTVIGWGTWEIMWRFAWGEVEERIKDVATIYNTLDNSQAMELLGKYNVEYIYIGALERKTYESDGLQKFATESGNYDLIYDAEGVNIFRVRGINGKG